ncbi:hypothetical protein [Acetatifactor aquisgranensis]|nr:hypothetical protein [Acetatifactor aquisgranensis]
MTEEELLQKNVEEFARLQGYMILAEGINLTELDVIKESQA